MKKSFIILGLFLIILLVSCWTNEKENENESYNESYNECINILSERYEKYKINLENISNTDTNNKNDSKLEKLQKNLKKEEIINQMEIIKYVKDNNIKVHCGVDGGIYYDSKWKRWSQINEIHNGIPRFIGTH